MPIDITYSAEPDIKNTIKAINKSERQTKYNK